MILMILAGFGFLACLSIAAYRASRQRQHAGVRVFDAPSKFSYD